MSSVCLKFFKQSSNQLPYLWYINIVHHSSCKGFSIIHFSRFLDSIHINGILYARIWQVIFQVKLYNTSSGFVALVLHRQPFSYSCNHARIQQTTNIANNHARSIKLPACFQDLEIDTATIYHMALTNLLYCIFFYFLLQMLDCD